MRYKKYRLYLQYSCINKRVIMKSIYIFLFCFSTYLSFGINPPANITRIINSGNGKTIETAYKVNSVDEEYELLRYLNLKPIMQKLYIKNGNFYDAIKTDNKIIYFKVVTKKLKKYSQETI